MICMKKILTVAITGALLFTMTACSGGTENPSDLTEPAGATLTVSLSHSCKAVPVTEDADFKDNRVYVRGDKIILWGWNEGNIQLGLYDTPTGKLVKTELIQTDTYLETAGCDYRDGQLTLLFRQYDEHLSEFAYEYRIFDDQLTLLETHPAAEGWSKEIYIHCWRRLSDGTQVFQTSEGFFLYDTENEIHQVSDVSYGGIVLSPDDTVWSIPDSGKPKRLDRETLTLIPLQMDDLPTANNNNGGYYDGFGEYPLLCTDTEALYGLKPDTGEKIELVNFADSDLVEARDFAPLPDGRFLAQSYDYLSFQTDTLLLTPRTQEEMDSIHTVTLAALYFDQETQSRIARFNRQADGYRLVLKSYYDNRDMTQSYEKCQQDYYNDLLAGNVPDIMLIGQDYQMLSNKGLFEDMRPWMEQDPDFHEEDYMMNVLEALGYKGHLERIPWRFGVCTNFAKTEFIGEQTNLSPADLLALDLPEGMNYLYSGIGKSQACRELLRSAMRNYVDYENGTCSFDSEEFISLLQLANTIPDGKLPEGDYCYQENTVLLYQTSLWSLSSYHMYHEVKFGNADVTLCGIGCEGGAVLQGDGIAVSAQSKEKQAAWEFIKFNLQENQQYFGSDNLSHTLPINRKALQKTLADDTIPHDENHKSSLSMDDVPVEYGEATQEELMYFQKYLDSLNTSLLDDTKITAIVTEESGKYFSGDCSAESAAQTIQGRVEIYLSEQG